MLLNVHEKEFNFVFSFRGAAGTYMPKVLGTWRGRQQRELQGTRLGRATLFSWATPSATLERVRFHLLKAKEAAETSRRFSTVLDIIPRPLLCCKANIFGIPQNKRALLCTFSRNSDGSFLRKETRSWILPPFGILLIWLKCLYHCKSPWFSTVTISYQHVTESHQSCRTSGILSCTPTHGSPGYWFASCRN